MVGYLTVRRKGYRRMAYTRKGGIRVKGTYVPPTTYEIKDIGAPGRGPRLIKIRRKGALIGLGYDVHDPTSVRRAALRRAIRRHGATTVFRMLMAQTIFRKRTDGIGAAFASDAAWVSANYGRSPRQHRYTTRVGGELRRKMTKLTKRKRRRKRTAGEIDYMKYARRFFG